MKIYIATNRSVGIKCKMWAVGHGFDVVSNPDDCDIYISILSSRILDEEFLKNRRAYNFHPAILPEYGGSPVYTMAIINGEKESGVTLHLIDKGIDTGNIIQISKFPIEPTDTAEDLRQKSEILIFEMFKNWLQLIVDDKTPNFPQNKDNARVYKKKELEPLKDLTKVVRALTLYGKEPAYFITSKGVKKFIIYE